MIPGDTVITERGQAIYLCPVVLDGISTRLVLFAGRYGNSRIAVGAMSSDSEIYGIVSINVPDILIESNEFVLNHDFNNDVKNLQNLLACGVLRLSGYASYGFVEDQPVLEIIDFDTIVWG